MFSFGSDTVETRVAVYVLEAHMVVIFLFQQLCASVYVYSTYA